MTLEHEVWKDFWSQRFGKDASFNMMDALERLESEIWGIAAEQLSEQAVEDLRVLATEIRQQYITQVFVTSIRASHISRADGDSPVEVPASLLSIIGLDPLASLSPAVREVTESRLLAERVYYYAQKRAKLLEWRVELLLNRSFATPEITGVLAQIDSVTTTAEQLTELAESYPAILSTDAKRRSSRRARSSRRRSTA